MVPVSTSWNAVPTIVADDNGVEPRLAAPSAPKVRAPAGWSTTTLDGGLSSVSEPAEFVPVSRALIVVPTSPFVT